jgi:peptide/nickel transport system substrate-binding protein
MTRRIGGLAITVVLLLAACTGDSGGKQEGLPPGHGGTLTAVMTQTSGSPYELGGLDPQVMSSSGSLGLARCCLFRTLMSYNGMPTGGGGAIPRPDLATGLPSVSSDRLTWRFTIKPGIAYAPPLQNAEVVAADFIRGIERALSPASPKSRRAYVEIGACEPGAPCSIGTLFAGYLIGTIEGAEQYSRGKTTTISGLVAPDPHTLQVRLTHPSGDLAYLFALQATAPIPPKPGDPSAHFGVAEGHDLNYGLGFAVGTGPYTVEGTGDIDFSLPPDEQTAASGATSDSITLVRDPSWDPATDDLRAGYPDRIVIRAAKDQEAGERMVLSGAADVVFDWLSSPSLVKHYRSSAELRSRVFINQQDALTALSLNLAVRPLDDIHVRKAINFAIDKQALVPLLFTTSQVATHVAPDGEENGLLLNYPHADAAGDLSGARREMSMSSYDHDRNGTCDALACRIIKIVVPDDPARVLMAKSIAHDLAPLGLHPQVVSSFPMWLSAFNDPTSHIGLVITGYVKDYPSATTFFVPAFSSPGSHSLLGTTPGQLKSWGYSVRKVPNVENRMTECEQELFAAQVTCWADFDAYMMQAVVAWVPLLSWTGAVAVSTHVLRFSLDQSTPFPSVALDRFVLAPATASPSG